MNTTEYRNLAEQVLKNKEDILKHFQRDEILADFGIRIIGSVLTKAELDAIPTAGLKYGDAYAVGTKSPFTYYIWTRANNISPVDYWFDFGTIAIAGPRGPQGPKGADGQDGKASMWYYLPYVFDYPKDPIYKQGDMIFDIAGNTYYCYDGAAGQYEYMVNIMGQTGAEGPRGYTGPQGPIGPQGPKGDTGDVGGFINIAGIIADEYSLPDPTLIDNLTVAYLVGAAAPYELYIQVGSTSDEAQWFNAGPLNVATMVTVGGQYQNTWDADTKVNKKIGGAANSIVYGQTWEGNDTWFTLESSGRYYGTIPQYQRSSGDTNRIVLKSIYEPAADEDLSNKKYVDKRINELLARIEALENAGIVKFRINGTEFKADEGMNWFDWVYSNYAPEGSFVLDGYVYVYDKQVSLYGTPVQEGDTIDANTDYNASLT